MFLHIPMLSSSPAWNYILDRRTEEQKTYFLASHRLFLSHADLTDFFFWQKNIRTGFSHADGADTRRFFLSHTEYTELTEFYSLRSPPPTWYLLEHEFHEWHEPQVAQVNSHAGKDLLIAYEFSRILPCGQKNRMAFVLFVCDEQRHIPQVIRVIREIRVL